MEEAFWTKPHGLRWTWSSHHTHMWCWWRAERQRRTFPPPLNNPFKKDACSNVDVSLHLAAREAENYRLGLGGGITCWSWRFDSWRRRGEWMLGQATCKLCYPVNQFTHRSCPSSLTRANALPVFQDVVKMPLPCSMHSPDWPFMTSFPFQGFPWCLF